ncbi:hypothetical protein [Roseivirga thermotolerans]|uniref:TFIIS-type domain-containing protein n=1 Tax=Roseivirga thermotolerans TaxID=1758176 RepID=A0ABQ3I7S3_9BACT|nr:hypothetical protein [Roseivirga thermotolerans]GHE65188.1 hypothetical protein GCM10011340_20330 [Roseivirga thermotolerans]
MDIKEIDKQFFKHIRPKKGAPKNLLDLDLNDVTVAFLEASCIYDFNKWNDCEYYEAMNEEEKDGIGINHIYVAFNDEKQAEIFVVTDLNFWFNVENKEVYFQFDKPEGEYEGERLSPYIGVELPDTVRELCALYCKFKFHLLSIIVAKRREIESWIDEMHNPKPIVFDPDELVECTSCGFVHKGADRIKNNKEGVPNTFCPRCGHDCFYPEDREDLPF